MLLVTCGGFSVDLMFVYTHIRTVDRWSSEHAGF